MGRCEDKEHYLCPGFPLCDGGIDLMEGGETVEKEPLDKVDPKLGKLVSVKVKFWERDLEILKELARARGTNMTGALRGAIGTEKFLADHAKVGKKFWMTDGNHMDCLQEIVFLYKPE